MGIGLRAKLELGRALPPPPRSQRGHRAALHRRPAAPPDRARPRARWRSRAACGALAERRNTVALRDNLRATTAKARALLSARDAWLSAGRESLMVWGADMSAPLSFGEGRALMEACLVGPDATDLSAALDALAANGTSFALICRTTMAARSTSAAGRPGDRSRCSSNRRAAASEGNRLPGDPRCHPDPDLDAAGAGSRAHLREPRLPCRFRNSVAGGGLQMNVAFDRSERDLASTARIDNETVEAKRFAVLSGQRRALNFTLAPLPMVRSWGARSTLRPPRKPKRSSSGMSMRTPKRWTGSRPRSRS